MIKSVSSLGTVLLFLSPFNSVLSKMQTPPVNLALSSPPQKTAPNAENAIYPGLRMIAEVIDLIEKKAIRIVDFNKFIEGGLKAAATIADAHTAFFSKQSYKDTIEAVSKNFSGIGISVISKLPEDDGLIIVDVIKEGPAQKAGLLPEDKIIEVAGEKVKGLLTDEVISKLKGPKETTVTIKIIRNKKLREFTVTRKLIKNEVLTIYRLPDQNIYYLSLRLFAENAAKTTAQILQEAKKKAAKGIIIDLRRNPGGVLEAAIDMASLFVEKGSLVVSTKNRAGKTTREYRTTTNPVVNNDMPIFFLIDNFTASASEILAGCLRYYAGKEEGKSPARMVFLVGIPTFGKGSVQEVIPLSNGCALKLTTMLYYLPNGSSIQAAGIEPDFVVKPKIHPGEKAQMIKELYGTETSIKNHITREEVARIDGKELPAEPKKSNPEKTEKPTKESWEEKQKKALNQDVSLQASINMINLLSFAKAHAPQAVETRAKALAFLKQYFVTDDTVPFEKINIK